MPGITMTRDLTTSQPNMRRQQEQPKNELSFGDESRRAIHQSHHGDDHPVMVTGTNPHSVLERYGDEYIVSDHGEEDEGLMD